MKKKAQSDVWGFLMKAGLVLLGLAVAFYLLYLIAQKLGVI
jgi:hypothetical protein